MAIKGFLKLLELKAPNASKEKNLESYFNRIIAINASKTINHFLSVGGRGGTHLLTYDTGEITSHLQGMLIQAIRFLDAGIKPVYVFDSNLNDSEEQERVRRFSRRVGVNEDLMQGTEAIKQQHEECKMLLELMGLPIIEAPSEGDAECADLCKSGKVYAVFSKDLDSLVFGAPRVLCISMDPNLQEFAVKEFELAKILDELSLTMDRFIDLCILSGCDYSVLFNGRFDFGGETALKLIYHYGTLENVLTKSKERFRMPSDCYYMRAKKSMKEPLVFPENEEPELNWNSLDEKGLMNYLVNEKGFDVHEITKILENVKAAKRKPSRGQIQSIKSVDSDLFSVKWKGTRRRDGLRVGHFSIRTSLPLSSETRTDTETEDNESHRSETPHSFDNPASIPSRDPHPVGPTDLLIKRTSRPSFSETSLDTEITYNESQGSETPGPSDNISSIPRRDPQPGDPTDLTGNPTKVNAVLHPTDGLWFDDPSVVHEVSHSFESFFDGPYTCWSKTPIPVRHKWWQYFRKQFSWDPSVAQLVKKAYEKKLKRRLSGTISRIGLDPNSKADWCPPQVRAELMRIRESDAFQQKSKQYSANKKSSLKSGRLHSQGSISTTYLKRKMEKELEREPTAAELFKRAHQTKDGNFIDETSALVWDEYEKLKRIQSQNKAQDNPMTDDEMFFQALGGWTEKGTLYGLGSAAKIYYDRFGYSSGKMSHIDHVKDLENKIEDINLKHQKEKDTQQEVITSQQKQIDQTTNDVKALQAQLEAMSQLLTKRKFGDFPEQIPCLRASLPINEMGDVSQSHLRSKKRGRKKGC